MKMNYPGIAHAHPEISIWMRSGLSVPADSKMAALPYYYRATLGIHPPRLG